MAEVKNCSATSIYLGDLGDLRSDLRGHLRPKIAKNVILPSWASGGGGVPASEASLPPEALQVVAEGDGLRVASIGWFLA